MHDDRLYKRGEVWWCRVRDHRGRIVRKSTKCREYEAARLAFAEFERISASPAHAAASKTTLKAAIEDLFADLERRGVSKSTLDIAQEKTGHFMRLWKGDMPLSKIGPRLVTDYISTRLSEEVKAFTVKKELAHLRQALVLARHHGTYHLEVEQVFPPFFRGKHVPRKRFPTKEELVKLLNQLHRYRAAHVAYIVGTGARKAEGFRARRVDVDFARKVVHVRGTKTELADDDVPITPLTEGLLQFALENAPGKDMLFHPWMNMGRDLKAACVRAGIAAVSPNDLRRAFGKWHRLAGVDNPTVAKMLRHTTDKLAQTTYAKLEGEEVSAVANAQLLGVQPTVLDLYPETGSEDTNAMVLHHETAEKQAPPARLERATFGLGNQESERRSVGTKLGVQRAAAAKPVPVLYDGWKGRGPAFLEATANLALLLQGVA
jgi:integrase